MSTGLANTATPLETMSFPLHGARLIEASAGTGKTFTIAGLYLRFILGHGDPETRHATALTVDQILVVTFTEAATAELRDRIRARIHDARIAFSRGSSDDPVIGPLLKETGDHDTAARLLLNAERQMDEAAVYTIHGFCQRMLTQNAFESGSRFSNEFVTDESHLRAQVVADYWRRQFYPLSQELAAEVRKIWAAPAELLADIGSYLSGAPLTLTVEVLQGDLNDLHQQNLDKIRYVKALWCQYQDDIQDWICHSDINKRSYTKKSLPQWIASVTAWAQSQTLNYDLPQALERFSQQTLNDKTPKGTPPSHELFDAVQVLIDEPASLREPLLAHAISHCRTMLAQAKAQKQWLSFDDLLTQLSAALDHDDDNLLATRIRQMYPVAMIDEFQDTDPLQYSIFSRIYLDNPHCGLFMIGDPKQAIYAFRGADIFTYIHARKQVTAHYTLGTNWRSSADMVDSVNQLFSRADSPFIYDQDIPFSAVQPSPSARSRRWLLDEQPQPAMTYWLMECGDQPVAKGEYQSVMAQATASQIRHILTLSQQGKAQFINGSQPRKIAAGDIAVLVRTGTEGRMIKESLAREGIASVYLSNRDSVFTSVIADDIQRLLQGVLTPENERALRASLASSMFALNARELDALNNDEVLWEQVISEFRQYRKIWTEKGVMPMLRAVLSQRHIAERWLEEENGERWLTDYMHIGELLQQAAQDIDSDLGLLRWLAQSVGDAALGLGGSDEQIQRLESERNLVQIVTIHKSKGLEYDLVFLPFVASYREASEGKFYDPARAETVLDIRKRPDSMAQADKERLAEDLRLIYVALTRAVYGCFAGVAPVRNGRSTKEPTGLHHCAIGYLLQNGQEGGIADLERALKAQISDCTRIEPPPAEEGQYFSEPLKMPELQARSLSHEIDRLWRVTSYSGLVRQGRGSHDVMTETGGFDIDSAGEQQAELSVEPEQSIFTFPRGSRPGTFLHSLFEEVEFTRPACTEPNREIITRLLENEQLDMSWLPILQKLIDDVLATPLDGKSLKLNQKTAETRLAELEFLLPVEVLNAPALNRVIQRHDPLSAQAGDLGFYPVQGMLKGFIDLVFEHQGRYYVLDWKSNHLGDSSDSYHGEALKLAMADHRYDLQYQIYGLALHRFLRTRIPDYEYRRHFGGVYYLFLRGMDGQTTNGVFYSRPDEALIDELDRLIDGIQPETRSSDAGQIELDL